MRTAAASCASWVVCYVDVWDPDSAGGRGISQCRVFEYARGHTQTKLKEDFGRQLYFTKLVLNFEKVVTL